MVDLEERKGNVELGQLSHLFEVLGEGDPKAAVPVAQHLACHQRVEHGRARQRHAEVEAEHPPVLRIPVELQKKKNH